MMLHAHCALMKSLEELYCDEHRCALEEFPRRVFWECLYRHALPFVPFVGGFGSDFFAADRGLILEAGRAFSRGQVREGIIDFFRDPGNQGWFKARCNLRISTRRLVRLSNRYLPGADSRAPIGETVPG